MKKVTTKHLAKNVVQLNEYYNHIASTDRLKILFDENDHKDILITSSFGASAITLLHMVHKIVPKHPIYFVNTGYLFKETIEYKNLLQKEFDLNIVEIDPNKAKHHFTSENKSWDGNTDLCCHVNKIEPLENLKNKVKFWISGIFRFQNENRSKLRIFEPSKEIIKFHPVIDFSKEEVELYSTIHDLPQHPLLYEGYGSLGCVQCTSKGDGREGRWINTSKTECGLHI